MEGRDLVKEAVKDAKSLKEAAFQAAKNELIESLAPQVRALVEQNLRGAFGGKKEDLDRLRRGTQDNWPGESHTKFEENKEKGDDEMELDMESIAGFFPQVAEETGDAGIPTLGEEEEPQMEAAGDALPEAAEEEPAMDEEIEISEAELRKVYEAALQTEAQVTKGFGDQTESGEEIDAAAGIADVKSGEAQWDQKAALPPAKKDWTVKEVRQMIERGLAENRALKSKLTEAVRVITTLNRKLSEVNLFNAKVLSVNNILQKNRLTTEQKRAVLETIDKAKTIDEVKMVAEAITTSFKVAGSLQENKSPRKPTANAQRARTSGAADQKVLRESVDRAESRNMGYDRLKELAGLVK